MGAVTDPLAIVHLEESLRRVLVGLVAHNTFFQKFGWGGPTSNPSSVSAARTSSSHCDQGGYNTALIFLRGKVLLAQPQQGTVSSSTEHWGGARQVLSLRKKYRRVRLKMWN